MKYAQTAPKICRKCGVEKTRADFYPHTRGGNAVSSWCRDCTNTTARDRQQDADYLKGVNRRSKLKRTYGITEGHFNDLLAWQGGGCAICGTKEPGGRGSFHVDHCHTNGNIRGLLCHSCNVALGCFADDIERINTAMNYLEKGGVYGFRG